MTVAATLMEQLLDAAIHAPSSHNTQPWRFRPAPAHIDVLADRTRALPVNDAFDRELTISCGCAIANVHAQAAAMRHGIRAEVMPITGHPDLLARLHVTDSSHAADDGIGPAASIEVRRTHRGKVSSDVPDAAVLARLVRAAQVHGVRWDAWQDPVQRQAAAALVEEGDRAQWENPRWRQELAHWMHPPRDADGLATPALAAPIARAVVRAADVGGIVGPRDGAAVLHAPLLAVLTTADDTPASWLATGRALQACLLVAADAGFHAAYFNQPMQVEALRPRLRAHCDGRWPQVMLRMGRPLGHAGARTSRRPLADMLVE